MKSYSVSFKQQDMLCDKCLINVVKSLSELEKLEEVQVDLETKRIKVKYNDEKISREDIKYIVTKSISSGKIVKLRQYK